MKKTLINIALTTAIILFTGCGGGSSDKVEVTFTEGKVIFADGMTLGVTRAVGQENGGFNIYDISTGEIVGFIALDGSVNDASGNSFGICQGLTITENGLNGECSLTINNPNTTASTGSTADGGNSSGDGSTSSTGDNSSTTEGDDAPLDPNTDGGTESDNGGSLNTDGQGAPTGGLGS